MFQLFFINIYLSFYKYYNLLWKIFFSWVGNLFFIYFVHNNEVKNITMNYYFKYNLDKFAEGIYYTKIYNSDGTNHVIFKGVVNDINAIKIEENDKNPPKRKNIILVNDDEPLNVNLEILDNYKTNMKYVKNSVTNLNEILKFIGINCTHVIIIDFIPFKKTTISINDIDINSLYHTEKNHQNNFIV